MFIQSLSLFNFKNHAEATFKFSEQVNCLVGRNGAGKTNVLDAIYYLSMCRSYLHPIDKHNIKHNEHFFVIQADWIKHEQAHHVYCGVKIGAKKVFKKNKKEYDRLADHIGQFPVVMISPYDTDLISDGSDVRRRWIDGIISQFDRDYLDGLQRYNKIVEQRNALLKQQAERRIEDPEMLEIWNEQLVIYAKEIYKKRAHFIEHFVPIFQHYYTYISEGLEQVSLTYQSQLEHEEMSVLIRQAYRKDLRMSYTTVGIHKDDLLFKIGEFPIKKFGSQGQQKCFLIALRLAQFDWLKNMLGVKPVLLLDDIFDKLDNYRVAQLMQLVSQQTFGQVVVTDTDEIRVSGIFSAINVNPNLVLFSDELNVQSLDNKTDVL